MQILVQEERHPQADMAASKVQAVELSVKSQYLQGVLERAEDEWCDEAGVEGKWSAVKSALVSTAEEVLGEQDAFSLAGSKSP